MEFKKIAVDEASLQKYVQILKECFPDASHLTYEYLEWLYKKNPDGHVFGVDAYENGELAAHYACIPTQITLNHKIHKALLSLNTATSPKFQGKGLFTKLARMTYDNAKEEGFSCVYGVANANSTPGFIKKLGFDLIMQLSAEIGMGSTRLDLAEIQSRAIFKRHWSTESLNWRCSNPQNPLQIDHINNDFFSVQAKHVYGVISPYGQIINNISIEKKNLSFKSPLKLFLGALPGIKSPFIFSFGIPKVLRPSPLNFIFKPLNVSDINLNEKNIYFNFSDFDAY